MFGTKKRKFPYQSPGELFIGKFGVPRDIDDVIHYADFLRQSAQVSDHPPINLTKIFEHFGIKSHKAPLIDQQGTSDGLLGFMLIKENDPETRQRFSEAHELIEFLFHEYKNLPEWHKSYYATHKTTKEKLCQKGAAALLMPHSTFVPVMSDRGISIESASELAGVYETSLLATLYRMLDECQDERLLVIWRFALKPTQEVNPAQQGLFGDDPVVLPQKKMRIWWCVTSAGTNNGFIPAHQSIHDDSIIARAYESGQLLSGIERLQLKGINGRYNIEAKKANIGDEPCVLALLNRYS